MYRSAPYIQIEFSKVRSPPIFPVDIPPKSIVNLKTAKALRLDVPLAVTNLARRAVI